MCGRYALEKVAGDLIEQLDFGILDRTLPRAADYNIAPTKTIPIIRQASDGGHELVDVSWGMVAPWSKSFEEARRSQSRAINARRESITERPTFRDSFRSKRCLIPADGYYEWATEIGEFPSKQPFYISRISGGSLFFAGIWSLWRNPEDGQVVESAALITRPAVADLALIHSRMPVFLPPTKYLPWLDRKLAHQLDFLEILEPAAGLQAYPVSTRVNKASSAGADLIEPVDLGEISAAHNQLLF